MSDEINKDEINTSKTSKSVKKETKKVKFLLSPTGRYNLGYNIGDVAKLNADLADELVEDKYAEYVK